MSLFVRSINEDSPNDKDNFLIKQNSTDSLGWSKIVTKFGLISHLCVQTRTAVGAILIAYMTISVLQISVDLNYILGVTDWVYMVFFILDNFVRIIAIILAADCNGQVCI